MTSTRSFTPTERHPGPRPPRPPRQRRTTSTTTKAQRATAAAPRSAAHRGAAARADALGIRIGSRRVSVSTLLLLDVVLLCVIGLVMVGSASSVISIATYGSPWAILIRDCGASALSSSW
jgi:hypothetical protein